MHGRLVSGVVTLLAWSAAAAMAQVATGLGPTDGAGLRALPASFIVDRQGHLAALALGPRRWDSGAAQALVERLTH